MVRRIVLALCLALMASGAKAACVPSNARFGSMGCEPIASSVLSSDYVQVWIPGAYPASAKLITVSNLLSGLAGTGTVTSVGLSMPSLFNVTGTPITGTGTLTAALATQSPNLAFVGPASGGAAAPTFRALVPADLPEATSSALGAVRPDNSTITISGGVLTAIGGGSGAVSSVGLALPASVFSVTGTPVTTSGTLTGTLLTQTANNVWAGPTTGSAAAPTFRALVAADLPLGSTSAFGAVKCDGSTITCTGGVIASVSGGAGTVVSVGLSLPAMFSVSGSPVTTTGTLSATLASQTANTFLSAPNGSSGAPTFRAIAAGDLPLGSDSAFGAMKCDNSTITCVGGVLVATGGGGGGSVSSVGVAVPAALLTASGSPITSSGTITLSLANQATNLVFAAPNGSTGQPAFRAMVGADLPLPTTSTIGGVKAITAVTNNWVQSITTAGTPILAQPLFSNIGGQATNAQLATQTANTVLGALTATTPSGLAMPSCADTGGNHLNWISGTGFACGTSGGGGGSLTVTDGTHSVTSTTTLTVGSGLLVGGSAGSATLGMSAPNSTKVANFTLTAAEMGGQVNYNGTSLTATIPAISSTILAAGMQVILCNQNSTALTISTTPTINGYPSSVPGTSPSGAAACVGLTSNGTSLDAVPLGASTNSPFLNATQSWSGTQTFGAVVGGVNPQVGTTYTLAASDCGKTLTITNAAGITLTTLNTLAVGCSINVIQGGAGQITVANGASATMSSAHSYTKTYGQWAVISLTVDANVGGTAAHIVFAGDGA